MNMTKVTTLFDLSKLELKDINERSCGNEYDYSREYYSDLVLQYAGKPHVLIEKGRHHSYNSRPTMITESQIAAALGVPFESQLRRQLFLQNTELFYKISNMHPELRKLAMGGTEAEAKVKWAREAVNVAIENLRKTIQEVEKRDPLLYLAGDHR